MAVARPILGLLAIILLAGGIVLQFLVILSGLYNSPEDQIYFLQADTGSIVGIASPIPNPARWTYLRLCGVNTANGRNANCFGTTAALPFDPKHNFAATSGVPAPLLNTSHYYYLSRISWGFYIVALFFAVVAIFISLAALFARLGAYLTGFTTFLAAFFQAVTAALMTAWVVQGERAFQSAGRDAKIGVKAMAFTWAAFAAWLLAALFFCIGGSVSKSSSTTTKTSYFGRKRSTRSRGSFVDNESGRRVIKEEYE